MIVGIEQGARPNFFGWRRGLQHCVGELARQQLFPSAAGESAEKHRSYTRETSTSHCANHHTPWLWGGTKPFFFVAVSFLCLRLLLSTRRQKCQLPHCWAIPCMAVPSCHLHNSETDFRMMTSCLDKKVRRTQRRNQAWILREDEASSAECFLTRCRSPAVCGILVVTFLRTPPVGDGDGCRCERIFESVD